MIRLASRSFGLLTEASVKGGGGDDDLGLRPRAFLPVASRRSGVRSRESLCKVFTLGGAAFLAVATVGGLTLAFFAIERSL